MDIYKALFWGCVLLCLYGEILILRATFSPPADAVAPSAHLSRSSRTAEIVWAILPLLALIALFWAGWEVLY